MPSPLAGEGKGEGRYANLSSPRSSPVKGEESSGFISGYTKLEKMGLLSLSGKIIGNGEKFQIGLSLNNTRVFEFFQPLLGKAQLAAIDLLVVRTHLGAEKIH